MVTYKPTTITQKQPNVVFMLMVDGRVLTFQIPLAAKLSYNVTQSYYFVLYNAPSYRNIESLLRNSRRGYNNKRLLRATSWYEFFWRP